MFRKGVERETSQNEFWVVAQELPSVTPGAFYERVDHTSEKMEIAEHGWSICASAYADERRGGRPGIDFKMLMVGFFEDLPSERATASRCADSLSVRAFLGFSLTEATLHHSSLSLHAQQLSLCLFLLLVRVALRDHLLLLARLVLP